MCRKQHVSISGWRPAGWRVGVMLAVCAFMPVLSAPVRADSAERRLSRFDVAFSRGRAAMADGLYELAERHFHRAIELGADTEERGTVAVWLARAALSRDRPDVAIATIRDVFDATYPTESTRELLFWLAAAHYEAGDAEEADSVLIARRGMGGDEPEPPEVMRLEGRIRLRQGRSEEAAAIFEAFDRTHAARADALDNLLDWAQAWVRIGRTDEAEIQYQTVIERSPQGAEAQEAGLRLARLRLAAGDRAGVDAWTEAVIHGDAAPPDIVAEAWLLRAQAAMADDDADGARRALDEARGTGVPEAVRHARLFSIRGAVAAGDLDEAKELLATLLADHPEEESAGGLLLMLADAFRRSDRHEEALALYRRHVEAYGPGAARAMALRGKAWSMWALGAYDEAAQAFDRFASHTGDEALRREAAFKIGDAYYAAERMPEAAASYLRFAESFPDDTRAPAALLQAADAYVATADFLRAAALLEQIERDAVSERWAAEASLRRGRMEERRRRWMPAVRAYGATIERYPDQTVFAPALLSRGLVFYEMGRFRDALADFQRLVDHAEAPDRIREQGFFMRGWSFYLVGEEEQAVAICRDFVAGFPDSEFAPAVLFWLGEHAYNRGGWMEAETVFVQLSERFPDHALADRALYWAGRSAVGGREFIRGIEHFARLTRTYPESEKIPEARFAQGGALSDLGRFDEAILIYREILRQFPDSYLAVRASGRIGDCHFTLAAEDSARYENALRGYSEILDRDDVPVEIRLEAEYKIGRCLERMDRPDVAFERYLNVVYGHLDARRNGQIGGPAWFARAGFRAGSIRERAGDWREAISVYRRVASAGGATAEEARERIQRIRRENWRIY